jgi:predicted nucleic acid-binding protein
VSFLLDTTVVSEWTKPLPNPSVIRWLAEVDEDRVYLSVMTLAELRYGTERLASGARKSRLETWLHEELLLRFEGRLLIIETAIADAWGRVMSRCSAVGKPIGLMDAFFAATAEVHALTLVTRNVSDFTASGISLFNPWS